MNQRRRRVDSHKDKPPVNRLSRYENSLTRGKELHFRGPTADTPRAKRQPEPTFKGLECLEDTSGGAGPIRGSLLAAKQPNKVQSDFFSLLLSSGEVEENKKTLHLLP